MKPDRRPLKSALVGWECTVRAVDPEAERAALAEIIRAASVLLAQREAPPLPCDTGGCRCAP